MFMPQRSASIVVVVITIASLASLASLALPACGGGEGSSSAASGADSAGATGSGGGAASAGTGSATTSGAGGGSIADCGPYTPGDDLHVCTATYLGGSGADHIGGLDIAPDGAVVLGGAIEGTDLGASAVTLQNGGAGAVVRLSPTGRSILSLTRVGASVTDLEVSRADGSIAVSGDFGVALLDASASALLWSHDLGGAASRVAVGSDGTVAALAGGTVSVFSAKGDALGTFSPGGTARNDVAVDGASQSVFVTGYRQDDGGACTQYKSTFVVSFGYDGVKKWTNYSWTHDDVGASGDCADSEGKALAMGGDGKLYYAGKSDGGNTVHQKDPRDLAKPAPNVASDQYNTPYGFKGANSIGYYARFDAATGMIEKGQFVVARKGSDASAEGNAATPDAIAADEVGNVFVAGSSAYQIESHDQKTINGIAVGSYVAYEAFALVVSADFTERLTWTVFTKSGPASSKAIAARLGIAAFGAEQSDTQLAKGTLITVDALQGEPFGGASEAFLSVWPAPKP
jgi:hypothetical protein